MEEKYLLYIDILGFANLIDKQPHLIRSLYNIIDGLNAHNHTAFKVIVFSDTILIYNLIEPIDKSDRNYIVMFLVEFAQNLFYEFAGKNLFFRAVITYGEFEYTNPHKVERFWGKALVSAYRYEKQINSTGLFIDNYCNKNNIFPSERFDKNLSFVYFTQSLDELQSEYSGYFPIEQEYLVNSDLILHLVKDLIFLKNIYNLMRTHKEPNVRAKFLTTWDYYKRRYTDVINILEFSNFDLKKISNDCDWSYYIKSIQYGFRGRGIKVPEKKAFLQIIKDAKLISEEISLEEYNKIYGKRGGYKPPYAPAGYAHIILDVDQSCNLGKFLLSDSLEEKDFSAWAVEDNAGIQISIRGKYVYQERIINEEVAKAILKHFTKELGIDGYITPYYD